MRAMLTVHPIQQFWEQAHDIYDGLLKFSDNSGKKETYISDIKET